MNKSNKKILEPSTRFEKIIGKDIENLEVKLMKAYEFLPDLMLHIGSFNIKKSFIRHTATANGIKDGLSFHFYNAFEYPRQETGKLKSGKINETSYIRVFPVSASQKMPMTKNTQATHLSVAVSTSYLRTFLREDAKDFEFLFDKTNIFLIEEIMTDNILRTVNHIAKQQEPQTLKSYHYKLKAMELLFYLFDSLRSRQNSVHQKLSEQDITSIYKVRDKIISSLSQPIATADLTKIAGMNEHKMRNVFTKVFGMKIYDYYQHFRMKEAARLLREEHFTVSETGYQMGFENLSHFSRVFEKHIGQKPKKYSTELR